MASASLQAFSLFSGSLGKARAVGFKAKDVPDRLPQEGYNLAGVAKESLPFQRSFHCEIHKERIADILSLTRRTDGAREFASYS